MDNKLRATQAHSNNSASNWFLRARAALALLKESGKHPFGAAGQLMTQLGINTSDLVPETGLAFELLPTHDRFVFLQGLEKVMRCSPRNSGATADSLELLVQKTMAIQALKPSPGGNKKVTSNRRTTTKKFKPKSKKAVKRMWAQLLRRVDMR